MLQDNSSILIQSWQRFRRLINNSINDDIFVNANMNLKQFENLRESNNYIDFDEETKAFLDKMSEELKLTEVE